jgi:hypothetical protein
MTPRVVREQNMVMSHSGLGTKNDCTGKGRHQFTRPDQASKALLMHMKFSSLLLDLI